MSTTLFAAASLLAPVQAMVRRLLAGAPTRHNVQLPATAPVHVHMPVGRAASAPVSAAHARPARPSACSRRAPPLRVLRVVDAGQSAPHGGRMLISGRMADVCAELDRLAAMEAALQPAG